MIKLGTFAFILICCFGIESLKENTNVFIELVPVSVDHIEHCIILHLTLFQLLYPLPEFSFCSLA